MCTALVLTGGRSRRFGRDKANALVDGVPMLTRVVGALPPEMAVVLVGPRPPALPREVTVCREEPPGGGPVAALAAGMAQVATDHLVLLATDLPVLADTPGRLAAALAESGDHVSAVMAVDRQGRPQPLCAAYRTNEVARALGRLGDPSGASVRSLVTGLATAFLPMPEVGPATAVTDPTWDVDTPADLAVVEQWIRADRETASERSPGC